ncbi:ATP-binding cassette domain-containing protein [Olsenella sp. YH-ols2217]|uniref:ATP-binding cassette domain-containing protein n=1 Tax=Kribbibacterium absianum TaxID=3044210 RepID=A0ABT6ZJE5_9ACTN|nr:MULTISPECIES: ATP-binding cassette domain-containing protein [unclassified Olsenella]MDJ1122844.1 ATP-binding cassette domain-containing protein [Olsenella sp. YH-ols2216]MDJ1129173.1 ATP-binding cassette domain-containing protein [Olsenella sp. YH-ols2217]
MTDNNATPTLEVRALSKTFNPGTTVAHRALDGVDLTLAPGEFACIVGSNGAGKSTLFNAVAGSVIPDAGLIRIAGKNVTFDPDYRRARCLSRVFQDPLKGTAPHLTVAENVSLALGRSQKGASLRFAMRKEKRDLIRERLATLGFGLEDRMDVKVGALSGGQRQAVTLLMATIGQPHLLLLDEHTAALDPEATERVLQLTDRVVREQGIATLMVTHDLGDALRYGDRTLVMHGGKIVADVSGPERDAMDVDGLLALFRASAGEDLADDKVLLKA